MYIAALYGEWWMLTTDGQVQIINMGSLSQMNAETQEQPTVIWLRRALHGTLILCNGGGLTNIAFPSWPK